MSSEKSQTLTFWETLRENTKKTYLRQSISLAKAQDVQFKIDHPDEARDLSTKNPNVVMAKERINKMVDKKFDNEMKRRKIHGGKTR